MKCFSYLLSLCLVLTGCGCASPRCEQLCERSPLSSNEAVVGSPPAKATAIVEPLVVAGAVVLALPVVLVARLMVLPLGIALKCSGA